MNVIKHWMMRLLCLCLALCLMMSCVPVLAEEDEAVARAPMSYVNSLVVRDGRILAFSGNDAYCYDAASRSWNWAEENDALERVFAQELLDGTGYSLGSVACGENGEMYLLWEVYGSGDMNSYFALGMLDAEGNFSMLSEKLELGVGENGYMQLCGFVALEDALVLCVWDDSISNYGINSLLRVSLPDGQVKNLGTYAIQQICAYKDGLLLGRYYDMQSSEMTDPQIVTIDPMTGDMNTIAAMSGYECGGVTWEEETDTIYYADSSAVYRIQNGGAAEKCGVLNPSYGNSDAFAVAVGGLYAVRDNSTETGVSVTTTDPALMPSRTLKLAFGWADDVVRGFANSRPDVAVEIAESKWDAQDITQEMINGTNAADVYSLSMSSGIFTALRDKGYCLDLSRNEALTAAVGAMYPHLTEQLYRDGKLCAVPASISANVDFSYYPYVLEAMGLTEDDLPTTWLEMMDFIERWYYDLAPEWEDDFKLIEYGSYFSYESMVSNLFSAQMLSCLGKGEMLSINHPDFLACLKRLEEIRPLLDDMFGGDDMIGGVSVFYGGGDEYRPTYLFAGYGSVLENASWSDSDDAWRNEPLMLGLGEENEGYIGAYMSVYFINPRSENQDLAVAFLEYALENMEDESRIMLCPDANEAVEWAYYETNMKEAKASLEQARKAMEEAEPEEQADMQMWLENAEDYMQYVEARRWAYSTEAIAEYREIADRMVLYNMDWASGDTTNIQTTMSRYIDGNMTAEQFVKEFDRIITMMQMENQ